jgi:RecJ-like exonuclease
MSHSGDSSEEEGIPCGKSYCAGRGCFECSRCPGSDEDLHHCRACGELWVNWKINICCVCHKRFCLYEHLIYLECTNTEDEDDWESEYELGDRICIPCFKDKPQWWCKTPGCNCEQKIR